VVAQAVAVRLCEARDLDHFDGLGSPEHEQFCRAEYLRGPDAVSILVAVDSDDVPVGKVHLDFELRRNEGIVELMCAAVLPQVQGRGIGTSLMREAEVVVRERGGLAIVLGVEASNPGARRLYERLGYQAVASHDFVYPGAPTPNPGVWMRKDLEC